MLSPVMYIISVQQQSTKMLVGELDAVLIYDICYGVGVSDVLRC
jgi:hypothetical protein